MDPGADWAAERQKIARLGCRVTPTARSGSTDRFTATGGIGAAAAVSGDMLIVESPDSYSVTVESNTAGIKTHESLLARRTGDYGKWRPLDDGRPRILHGRLPHIAGACSRDGDRSCHQGNHH